MDTKINIRESLNKYDLRNNNKYDLRNLYDSCIMDDKEKRIIAEMIYNKVRANVLYEALMNKFEGKPLIVPLKEANQGLIVKSHNYSEEIELIEDELALWYRCRTYEDLLDHWEDFHFIWGKDLSFFKDNYKESRRSIINWLKEKLDELEAGLEHNKEVYSKLDDLKSRMASYIQDRYENVEVRGGLIRFTDNTHKRVTDMVSDFIKEFPELSTTHEGLGGSWTSYHLKVDGNYEDQVEIGSDGTGEYVAFPNVKLESLKEGTTTPRKDYVRKVCDAMNWYYPTFADPSVNGYACKWGGYSFGSKWEPEERAEKAAALLAEIEKRTGIKCSYTPGYNKLIIPYAPAPAPEIKTKTFVDPPQELIDRIGEVMGGIESVEHDIPFHSGERALILKSPVIYPNERAALEARNAIESELRKQRCWGKVHRIWWDCADPEDEKLDYYERKNRPHKLTAYLNQVPVHKESKSL